ncbi:hypothetical protein SORBI_3004G232201 [Sorghum bicolor]|uniref:Uncharacterized protein n=1 Tax=Sorghum bicolor TaxID=4558 RepID=A0A1Z5RNW7_SORBI|nr:hypothetical protein SORBI_3004G232201 [Sorghum bicolor]
MDVTRRGTSYLQRVAAVAVVVEFFIGFLICTIAASKFSCRCPRFGRSWGQFEDYAYGSDPLVGGSGPWCGPSPPLYPGCVIRLHRLRPAARLVPSTAASGTGDFFDNKVAPVLVLVQQRRLPLGPRCTRLRVLDAPTTLHQRLRHLRRHGQHHLRRVQIHNFIVNWSSSKNMSVNYVVKKPFLIFLVCTTFLKLILSFSVGV